MCEVKYNMLARFYLRLEIIGYSRAIGAMTGKQGITVDHMKCLYDSRKQSRNKLARLKAKAKQERFGKVLSNA